MKFEMYIVCFSLLRRIWAEKRVFSRFRKIPPPKQPKPLLMNDIVYLTKRFETISIKTKHYPGRGSIEEIATLSDWKDGKQLVIV